VVKIITWRIKKMKYQELREMIQNWPKYPDCVKIERSPLIHEGFPGTFNLSFCEKHWLDEYGRYIDFPHDFIFSTVQSCIRPDDIQLIATNAWKYLGVFEMADVTGMIGLINKPDYVQLQGCQIASLIKLLKSIGISENRIYPTYCAGGKVAELTRGKYSFDFNIPEDKTSKNAFLDRGIPENNLSKDTTRDTFLSLHLHRPTPWGYRNEILVNVGSEEKPKLLDVATVEYCKWRAIYNGHEMNSKNIVGLKEFENGVSIVAVGLERLCMIVNDLERVQDIDYIKPFYDSMTRLAGNENLLAGESLRGLHRIYSDIQSYGCNPGRHQKAKINQLIQNIPKEITPEHMKFLLRIHSETQPWHNNLREGIGSTIERIERYRCL
jgi:hypothetical protein